MAASSHPPSPAGKLAVYSVEGVLRGAVVGNLAGQKIRITSPDPTPLLSPGGKMILAVTGFRTVGLDSSAGTAVADLLQSRLVGLPGLTVVERERINAVLQEQNLQNSDRFDSTTAVQLGRLLGATRLMFGTVSNLGDTWTVSAQLVDVGTGRIEGVREVQCDRCTASDLPDTVDVLAAAVARR
jgi:hypothetical protein